MVTILYHMELSETNQKHTQPNYKKRVEKIKPFTRAYLIDIFDTQ